MMTPRASGSRTVEVWGALHILPVLLTLLTAGAGVVGTKLKVVEGQVPNSKPSYNEQASLSSFVERQQQWQAANYTGPEHLLPLNNTCYTYLDNSYQYHLCLFSNMTQQHLFQQQQHYGLPVSLGVYSGWNITHGQFSSVQLKGGQSCSSDSNSTALYRSTEILLQCGPRNELTGVSEPRTCHYHANFSSPLLCGDRSVMAVYPRLNPQLQLRWDRLLTEYTTGLLTQSGYDRLLREHVFEEANFVWSDDRMLELADKARRGKMNCEERVVELEEKIALLEAQLRVYRRM